MGEMEEQEYSWGTFRWYFDQFRQWGLDAIPFYWRAELKKQDVDLLFQYLLNFEVVILGGGNSYRGLQRYRGLAKEFYGDDGLFERILHERQNQGKLTAGFSAGADQLCEYLVSSSDDPNPEDGFGLARSTMVFLHHERGREGIIHDTARRFHHCMTFGLPNDSGLAIGQGYLRSGNLWQITEFLIDSSWDIPQDQWHIKTRQGVRIEHFYCDGRHWTFNGGDKMVRVMSRDNRYQEAWLAIGGRIIDYWSQRPTQYQSIDEILNSH
jgi:hypothetical protein